MDRLTITATTSAGLCSGCGVCKGICPKDCIRWDLSDGMYLPSIDAAKCVHCGICAEVCSGLGHRYEAKATALETITGTFLECCNSWTRDPDLRHVSASGGVITTMVQSFLSQGLYDSVFCLNTYDYREQLRTMRFSKDEFCNNELSSNVPKSRYLPVSHEEAIHYMKNHREERIILIGTSCALRGLIAAIEKLKLNRENYLLIGLFCDSIFNYNVVSYLEDHHCNGNPLAALHFKNKESGGWPGDMKLFPENSDSLFVPINERGRLKEYFMPERCLYCLDKLNVSADISIGDNYTPHHSSKLGSNSVILRTARGVAAWKTVQDFLTSYPIDIAEIQKAQYLDGRINNLYFSLLKGKPSFRLNEGIPIENKPIDYLPAWRERLKKLISGACYCSSPAKVEKQMKKKKSFIHRLADRGISYIDRLWNRKRYS